MAKGFGADVRKTIRPPLSPHRQSGHSELLEPKDPDLALRFLSGTSDTPNGTKPRLPSTVLQLLRFGDLHGRYASRSELIQAITNAAYEWVWDFGALFLLLMDTENVAGEKIREKEALTKGSGESYLKGSWDKAAIFVGGRQRVLVGHNVKQLAGHLRGLSARMSNLSATEFVVLDAHLQIMGRAKSTTYTLSMRQAAELAGCDKNTARNATKKLVIKGFLAPPKYSIDDVTPSTWSIHIDIFHTVTSSRAIDISHTVTSSRSFKGGCEEEYVWGMSPSHDVFSNSGLNKTCYRLLRVFVIGYRTTKEIAEVMGVSVKTVQRSLKALTKVGLIKTDTSGRLHVVLKDLDLIANELGVAGTEKKRKEAHSKERSKYLASQVGGNSADINAPLNITSGTPGPTAPKKRLEATCEVLNGKPRRGAKTVRPGGGKKQMRKKVITTR